jgi:hypothetical protein
MIRQATTRRATDEVAQARAAARRAYEAARAAGGITALTAARYWAETLTLLEGKTQGTQAEMFDRTRYLLELIVDRTTWSR